MVSTCSLNFLRFPTSLWLAFTLLNTPPHHHHHLNPPPSWARTHKCEIQEVPSTLSVAFTLINGGNCAFSASVQRQNMQWLARDWLDESFRSERSYSGNIINISCSRAESAAARHRFGPPFIFSTPLTMISGEHRPFPSHHLHYHPFPSLYLFPDS